MDLTTPYLPVDIYRYVVAEVSEPADLITLCLVSSCVRHEAERILYRTITIRNLRQLQVWSSVIASSPRLADLIRFLAIPLRMEASADLGIIRNHIHIALKNAINLKHLALRMSKGQEFCVLAWMLFGCSFRLHTLSGETFSFTPDEWWRFLSEQPEIHTWTPGYPITEDLSLMPAGILPNLSGLSLSFSSLLTGFPLRPIERLSFRIWPASTEPDDTASLGRFRDTLIKLTCRIEGRPYSTAPATHLASIASQAPRLTYLNYTGIFAPELISDIGCLTASIASLKCLETLLLCITTEPAATLVQSMDHARQVALKFMASCPSLRLVSLGPWEGVVFHIEKTHGGEIEARSFCPQIDNHI